MDRNTSQNVHHFNTEYVTHIQRKCVENISKCIEVRLEAKTAQELGELAIKVCKYYMEETKILTFEENLDIFTELHEHVGQRIATQFALEVTRRKCNEVSQNKERE